jgi:hypothetical protein
MLLRLLLPLLLLMLLLLLLSCLLLFPCLLFLVTPVISVRVEMTEVTIVSDCTPGGCHTIDLIYDLLRYGQ